MIAGALHLNPMIAAGGALKDLYNNVQSKGLVKGVAGALGTELQGAVNSVTGGYLPQIEGGVRSAVTGNPYVQERDAVAQRLQQGGQDYPNIATQGNVAGAAAQAMALNPLFKYLGSGASAVSRIAGGALGGAATAAAQNPGDTPGVVDPAQAGARTQNAVLGGLTGGAVSSAAEAGPLMKWLGKKTGGLSSDEATAYANNPQSSDELYKLKKTNPLEFERQAKSSFSQGADQLQTKYLDPRKAQIDNLVADKTYKVNQEDVQGTAAEPLFRKEYADQGHTMDVPTGQLISLKTPLAEMTPMQISGPESKQAIQGLASYPGNDYPGPITTHLQEIDTALTPMELDHGQEAAKFVDYGTQAAPKPFAGEGEFSGTTVRRAGQAAGKAGKIRGNPNNPVALTPSDFDKTLQNAATAEKLNSLLKQDPVVESLFNEVHEGSGKQTQLTQVTDPSQFYNKANINATGALKQFFDENAGTNFRDTTNGLNAAQELDTDSMGLVKGAKAVAAKKLLQNTKGPASLKEALPALLQGLFNNR
jgi:hypothetical protein